MTTVGLLKIDLEFVTSGGVTAPELDAAVDLPLSRARDGEMWTPPTSLVGSLRAHLGGDAARWLGSDPPTAGRAPDREKLDPSRLRFLGSRTVVADTGPQIRRSTAIDPERGAAATATLRAAEVAPAGTVVTLHARIDDASRDELAEITDAVRTWRPVIGRGRSAGHGRARVTGIAWRRIDLRTRDGLRSWLTGGQDALFPAGDGWDQIVTVAPPAPERAELDLHFVIDAALHVGSGNRTIVDGDKTSAAVAQADGRAIIPGTTWKGLLRSRCGYILRSCGRPACLVPGKDATSCTDCMLCSLFGWTGANPGPGLPTGRVGRLTVTDSPITGAVTQRNHVGIDRFTGGARRNLLFADDVVATGDVSLHITTTDATDRLSASERGLLLLAIRDLHDGLIGVGRGTTRGYGSLRLGDDSAPLLDELRPGHPTGEAVLRLLRGDHP